MQEHSKISLSRSKINNEESSDNLSYLIEKKIEMLSRLKTESANLEQLINAPSQEINLLELEHQIEEMDLKCYLENQYTKVLENIEKRTQNSNKIYKARVESMHQEDQNIKHRINSGAEIITEAEFNNKEGMNKVTYMKSSLSLIRSIRKDALTKSLLVAQKKAKNLYKTKKHEEEAKNQTNEKDAKLMNFRKQVLRKLEKISESSDMRLKETNENLSSMTSLFKSLGMPDLSECLIEYESVVVTNESLSKKTDILLREIHQLQENIKELTKNSPSIEKKSVISVSPKKNRPKLGENYEKMFVNIFEQFKDLNRRLAGQKGLEINVEENLVENIRIENILHLIKIFTKRILKCELKLLKRLATASDEKIEVVNKHPYIRQKKKNREKSEGFYSDNTNLEKHALISDIFDSAMQVEKKARQIVKDREKDIVRSSTPLDWVEVGAKEEADEGSKTAKQFDKEKEKFKAISVFEKKFDSNIKKVYNQTVSFRKNYAVSNKNAKYYCQEMLSNKASTREIKHRKDKDFYMKSSERFPNINAKSGMLTSTSVNSLSNQRLFTINITTPHSTLNLKKKFRF